VLSAGLLSPRECASVEAGMVCFAGRLRLRKLLACNCAIVCIVEDLLVLRLPSRFDAKAYRDRYEDLSQMRPSELREHWRRYGRSEGRNASSIDNREQLLACLRGASHLLEIGPFDRPSLRPLEGAGCKVDYADYLSRDQLVQRASAIPDRKPSDVPPIRYVLSDGGYEQIRQPYDAVVSHHCLEHQPDLIDHLLRVSTILSPGGVYLCTVPDMRFCFDHFLPPTGLVDIIAAHLEKRLRPGLHSVIEHRCFTPHDWQKGRDPFRRVTPGLRAAIDAALGEYSSCDYVDVHCWKFTGALLSGLIRDLAILGFLPSDLSCRLYNLGGEFALAMAFDRLGALAFR